jgi:hypothetical protein
MRSNFKVNYEKGRVTHHDPTLSEDLQEGVDFWLQIGDRKIPFACRRLKTTWKRYRTITIRYAVPSGEDTEYHKLLAGKIRAQFYAYRFDDASVIVRIEDVITALREGKYDWFDNADGTKGAFIRLIDLKNYQLVEDNGIPFNT